MKEEKKGKASCYVSREEEEKMSEEDRVIETRDVFVEVQNNREKRRVVKAETGRRGKEKSEKGIPHISTYILRKRKPIRRMRMRGRERR